MKKILIGLASLTLFSSSSLVTAACTTSNHNTEIIKLKNKQINLTLNETNKNNCATDQIINFTNLTDIKTKSENNTIATANYNQKTGMITIKAINLGSTTIIISAKGCKEGTINITVSKKIDTFIKLNKKNFFLTPNASDKNNIKTEEITNYSNLENVKVKSNDKTIATASYDSSNGIITIKGIKKGTTTISVSANGCKTALIQITVSPIAKNIIINKKWGIISGNNKTTFVILNNSLLKNLKINSDNKNISFDYNQKTGSVSVYSNDGLGYWATITISAKNISSISFFVFVLNNKYWWEEVSTISSGLALVASSIGYNIYKLYKEIENYFDPLLAVQNNIDKDQNLLEDYSSYYKNTFFTGNNSKTIKKKITNDLQNKNSLLFKDFNKTIKSNLINLVNLKIVGVFSDKKGNNQLKQASDLSVPGNVYIKIKGQNKIWGTAMIPWKITNKINIARSNSNLSNTLCKANENSFFLFTEVSLWVIKKLNSINQYPFQSSSFNLDLYYDKNCTKEIFEAQNLKSITSPTLIYGKISTTSLDPIWFGQKIISFKFQYTG